MSKKMIYRCLCIIVAVGLLIGTGLMCFATDYKDGTQSRCVSNKEDKCKPKPTEPKPTEPKETEPKETEPKETEPKETEPKETEPKETEPKETEPKETEPKETEPEPTEPEKTEDKLPKTGDSSHVKIFFTAMVMALVGMVVLIKFGKKKVR